MSEGTEQPTQCATYVFPKSYLPSASQTPASSSSSTEKMGVAGTASTSPTSTPPTDVVVVGRRGDGGGAHSKGHFRSASHGGVVSAWSVTGRTTAPPVGTNSSVTSTTVVNIPPASGGGAMLIKGHARARSHGQIADGGMGLQGPPMTSGYSNNWGWQPHHQRGHSRTGSKTDFILPPGHQDREHQRTVSRTDSFFHGHSRQASRSESIYTLQTPSSTFSLKERLLFWRRRKSGSGSEEGGPRLIVPNHMVPPDTPAKQHPNKDYPSNHIRTTKYTVLSFLPKNLFEQFHRFANLYFLGIVLLNWVPQISAFGKEIAMLPVVFVLGVTAIKDIFEDRRRHRSDRRINNSTCRVYRSELGRYVKVLWKELRVGDLVHLSCNEIIPADILVLRSSDDNGLCYIETSNLDGESSLKQREVVPGFVEKQGTFQPSEFQSRIEASTPTTKIYRFHGCMVHPNGQRVPVNNEHLLLRDCVLKNTDFVEGIVLYAGHETKAMLNNGGPRYKRSALERQMNWEVLYCVVILIVLCGVGAVGAYLWVSSFTGEVPFILLFDDSTIDHIVYALITFLVFVVILQVMIPLSLYVTLEVTKLMQVYHIHNDVHLYDPECDKRVECRALNIPEELGQIQYIFSDKTGTLTENKMIFRRCTIGGVDYHHALREDATKVRAGAGMPMLVVNQQLQEELGNVQLTYDGTTAEVKPQYQRIQDFFLLMAVCNTVVVAKHPHRDEMNASGLIMPSANTSLSEDSEMLHHNHVLHSATSQADTYSRLVESRSITPSPPLSSSATRAHHQTPQLRPQHPRVLDIFPSAHPLSPICSSSETTPTDSPNPNGRPRLLQLPFFNRNHNNHSRSPTPSPAGNGDFKPIFEAESPDELALVDAAYVYDCRLLKRTTRMVRVSMPGEGLLEFDVLHVLPFDSVRKRMSVLLKNPLTGEKVLYLKGADSSVLNRLKPPGTQEKREMVIRMQQHLNGYAKHGLRILVMAKRILTDEEYLEWLCKHREAELSTVGRDHMLMESYSRIEKDLELLGATGIEDRLQEGVPEAISSLRRAGIIVWVLTGDKQETAVNIAYSCKLFSQDMDIIKLNARSCRSAEETIRFYLEQAERDNPRVAGTPGTVFVASVASLPAKQRALVVDGKTLTFILAREANLQKAFLSLTKHCSAVLCCRTTPLQKSYMVRVVKEQLGVRTLAVGDGANDVSMIQAADVGVGISGKEGMQAVMASDFAISRFKHLERLLLVHGHWCYDRLARMVQYFFYKNAAYVFVIFWFQLYCGFTGAVMMDQMYLQLYNLLFTSFPPMAIGIYDKDAPEDLLLACPSLYRQGRIGEVYKPMYFWLNMADALYQSVIIFFVALGAYHGSNVGIWEFGTTITAACLYVMLFHMAIETKSWTVIHVLAMAVSITVFYGFAWAYNSICLRCHGLSYSYGVIQETIVSPTHWFVVLLSVVLALLPRFVARSMETFLLPSAVTRAMLANRKCAKKNEFFVSWSRSTSSSSVFRPNDTVRVGNNVSEGQTPVG